MTHRWGYPIVVDDDVISSVDPAIETKIDQILAYSIAASTDAAIAKATAALAATAAQEIEDHLHNYERWLGKLAVPAGGKVAAEATLTPFQAASGNNTWGTPIQILDTNDTPLEAGMVRFDPHRIVVVDTSATTTYRIRVAFGATYAAGLAAGEYSGLVIRSAAATRYTPLELRVKDHVSGTKVWLAIWNLTNLATVDFLIGLHEYAS